MIGLKNLHKTYITGSNKLHVLKGIDVQIKTEEMVSVMGSSGSGKSTLLNIIGLLDNHDEGEYYIGGEQIKEMSETKAAHYRDKMLGLYFSHSI